MALALVPLFGWCHFLKDPAAVVAPAAADHVALGCNVSGHGPCRFQGFRAMSVRPLSVGVAEDSADVASSSA